MTDPLRDFAHRAIGHIDRGAIDVAAVEVMETLAATGVDALMLKGPVTASWLYGPGEARGYGDCDVLAAPDRFASAGRTMRAAGFHLHVDEATHPEVRDHGTSQVWHRQPGDTWIDLQWRLTGFRSPPAHAWEIIWAGRTTMTIAGHAVPVPSEAVRALHLASLAAAADADARKPLIDLQRAVARLAPEVWREAAELSRSLDAAAALRDGLERVDGGAALLSRVGGGG